MQTITDLIKHAGEYMPDVDLAPLQKAYDYAVKIYGDTVFYNGQPYISHPLAVSYILANMRLDLPTLMAGLLHGVLKESTTSSEQELRELFGKDVATIVCGASRITNVRFNSTMAYQAENIRKMLLAMSSDIRVLLVKLADRLNDMQNLKYLPPARQQEFARETHDLYAPLASRLGVDWMKRELEDLAFAYLHPEEYTDLTTRIKTSMHDRTLYVEKVKKLLHKHLAKHGLTGCRILGRPKHLYSIYRKLVVQNIPLDKVYDKVAFRIIVNNVRECYEALGVVHSLWGPVDGRFKDFISKPKANMYQSLHTSVIGPYGEFMEIQIRTEEMDKIALEGIAAHWAYKEGMAVSKKDARLFQWMKQLIHWLQELKDPKEFLNAVKDELHYAEIYVLTPAGEVKEFPKGGTPLDFAYSIHTEVGNRCTGAKVNDQIVPLKYKLKNGDLVKIITSPKQKPNRGWLSMVKTSRAKSRIRQWLNRDKHESSLIVGQEIIEKKLKKHGLSIKRIIKTGQLKGILHSLSCNSLNDLVIKVGSGKISAKAFSRTLRHENVLINEQPLIEESTIAGDLKPIKKKGGDTAQKDHGIKIDGIDNVLTRLSNCCMPVPGDDVMGYITAGRGISIHKVSCPNFQATDPQRRIEIEWGTDTTDTHRAHIRIVANDQKGLLATLSNTITLNDANIVNVTAHTSPSKLAVLNMVVEVNDLNHISKLLNKIRRLDGVMEARRK
ncbi:MAG: bifunctional (p)ppGpp synthetase/guanosine-3',5'-bis(diphosphate) 3'-pyrophosphohydrolase [Thermodesulfobacteriota bacterium]|nr:bifunctional (p)ppGpp synthetase/guanosine-3',5'-bis(diphosphate) 3'-pyrophosphohydrolase [Thermodesulfobacteriota bacterium]